MRGRLGIHPAAVVGDAEHGLRPPGARQGHLDHEAAAVGHRVARIDGEVGDHLLELGAIGVHEYRGVRDRCDELDLVADQLPEQLLHVGHDLTQVDDLRLQHLATPECEQLLCQLRCLIRGRKQVLDVRAGLVLLALESLERELAVAADREEEVVEVVGDTACETVRSTRAAASAEAAPRALAGARLARRAP